MKKCGPECESICGFCEYYNEGFCYKTRRRKKPYDDCNCNKFKCFTLSYYYNASEYVTSDYLKQLREDADCVR